MNGESLGAPIAVGLLARSDLARLFHALGAEGRQVIGPAVADGAIVLRPMASIAYLPVGVRADQAPGSYRLRRTDSERAFDYGPAAGSWKPFAYPPRLELLRATRDDAGAVTFEPISVPAPPTVLFGIRPCELRALEVLDRAVQGSPVADPDEIRRRNATLTVAVECAVAGCTCFCTSMGTGPGTEGGFDVALTELDDGFLVRVGSERGRTVAVALPLQPVPAGALAARRRQLDATASAIGTPVATEGLPARLHAAWDSPRWAEIAARCLACGNCTLACPTCFCTSTGQHTDLDGTQAVTERRWDSCFTEGFAAVAGGNFRPRIQDRYRQWLTHKFGTWMEQFGSFGCVGCGRCVTWCPVGIDVREELAFIAPARPVAEVPMVSASPGVTPLPAASSPPRATPPDVATERIAWPFAPASVIWSEPDTADVRTLRLAVADPGIRHGRPGQFVMAELPGFPAAAISISRYHPDGIELTVRAAGPATAALGRLTAGMQLGLRGPLGRPWPMGEARGRDLLIVAGGIGLAPLRSVIDTVEASPGEYGRMHICYGAKTPADRLYVAETGRLSHCACADVAETVDRPDATWAGSVGVVTCLLDERQWDPARVNAFMCGPERMMQVVAKTLGERGVTPDRIWLTLERHMDCGVGLCGHCQVGPYFVCRDGPVFSYAELGGVFGIEGI